MTIESGAPTLTSVHEALNNASLASKEAKPMKNFSVRLHEDDKAKAQAVCERHGTDLGTYLRECVTGLLRDYGLPTE